MILLPASNGLAKNFMARNEAVVFVAMGCGNPDMKVCDMWMVCGRLFSRSVELECKDKKDEGVRRCVVSTVYKCIRCCFCCRC